MREGRCRCSCCSMVVGCCGCDRQPWDGCDVYHKVTASTSSTGDKCESVSLAIYNSGDKMSDSDGETVSYCASSQINNAF